MNDEELRYYTGYIQAKYFRTGVYTHLNIDFDEDSRSKDLTVSWTFTFQDLGQTHVITRGPVCVILEHGHLFVDNAIQRDVDEAERTIFAGFYADYTRELYQSQGIQPVQ
jgi:hypothetical protein